LSIRFKKNLPIILVFIFGLFLFIFRILTVPPGIETDEGSIAYNASLISKNLRDQNQRFLPFFILSSDKLDWKQPVLIYLSALYFKIFGASLLVFKLVNISVSFVAIILIYYLLTLIFKNKKLALIGSLIAFTSPMVIITSRLGNESIQPILWTTLWLLGLKLYSRSYQKKYLILSAISLGIGFYSFKGMRVLVPVWAILTFVYLFFLHRYQLKKFFTSSFIFGLVLSPFFLITPLLELKYAGAVFDRKIIHLQSYRFYFYYWLQNLSLAFLFTQPDIGKIYEMEYFGPFLLFLAPFFLIGIINIFKKIDFLFFVFLCFIFTPALFGLAGSLNYSHRLVALVPFFIIITTFGIEKYSQFFKNKSRLFFLLPIILVIFNFYGFFKYYYFDYPQMASTRHAFGNNLDQAFSALAQESKKNQLTPYVQAEYYQNHGDGSRFYEQAYFKTCLKIWHRGDTLPPRSILLTEIQAVPSLQTLNYQLDNLYLLTSL